MSAFLLGERSRESAVARSRSPGPVIIGASAVGTPSARKIVHTRNRSSFEIRGMRTSSSAPGPGATNVRGTIAFAGGAHPTQLFVNLGDNSRLDRERTVPFAQVDDAGMAVLDRIYTGYKEGSGQVAAYQQGVDELQRQFPRMSWIERCAVEAERWR